MCCLLLVISNSEILHDHTENTMLVSLNIKFIRRDQKKNNIRTVEPDKLDIKRFKQGLLFVMHHQLILRGKDGHDIIVLLPYLCYRDILKQMSVCDNMSVSVLRCNFPSGPYGFLVCGWEYFPFMSPHKLKFRAQSLKTNDVVS